MDSIAVKDVGKFRVSQFKRPRGYAYGALMLRPVDGSTAQSLFAGAASYPCPISESRGVPIRLRAPSTTVNGSIRTGRRIKHLGWNPTC